MRVIAVSQDEVQAANDAAIPDDDDFDGADYLPAPGLANIGRWLIDECDELNDRRAADIRYLWKRKGGTAKGKARLGSCQLAAGLVKHLSENHFIITASADNCRRAGLGVPEIYALVYHELKHVAYAIDEETGEIAWAIVGHDVETFRSELVRYGFWTPDLERFEETLKQVPLF